MRFLFHMEDNSVPRVSYFFVLCFRQLGVPPVGSFFVPHSPAPPPLIQKVLSFYCVNWECFWTTFRTDIVTVTHTSCHWPQKARENSRNPRFHMPNNSAAVFLLSDWLVYVVSKRVITDGTRIETAALLRNIFCECLFQIRRKTLRHLHLDFSFTDICIFIGKKRFPVRLPFVLVRIFEAILRNDL